MSFHTKHLHRQLVTILTIQAALPCFVLLGISIYILGLFEVVQGPELEVLTFIIVELPALISPIVVVTHIRSYHDAAVSLLKWRAPSRPPSTSFANHILDIPLTSRRPVTPISPKFF
ncbi:hypothetical protein PMAYCL1PPCAC_05532, partial [Pristionchus mayeri]